MIYDFDSICNNSNIGSLSDSFTPEILKSKGIVSFEPGEMTFKTAPSLIESCKLMAEHGVYGFTLADNRYTDSIIWWLKRVRGYSVKRDYIVPALGTIFAIATMIRLVSEKGNGVIIQPPVYNRYEQAIRRLERKPVYNNLIYRDSYYYIDFEDLEKKMADSNNRLLIICNPQNPLGRVWKENELHDIGRLSEKYHCPVISDEIFADITFGDRVVPYTYIPEGREYAVSITSLGKSFNLTGVNNSNLIIESDELRERYIKQKYSDHYGSVGPFEYSAVTGAYNEEGMDWFMCMKDYIYENIQNMNSFFEKHRYADIIKTEASTVCWIDWSRLNLKNDRIEDFLLKKALIHIQPGVDFDSNASSFTRWNFATSHLQIENALNRLKEAMNETI